MTLAPDMFVGSINCDMSVMSAHILSVGEVTHAVLVFRKDLKERKRLRERKERRMRRPRHQRVVVFLSRC